jgi:hypothetical protein
MELTDFSRLGGRKTSVAKTAANRAKSRAYWRKVRSGEILPPRRYRNYPMEILAIATRYIWWEPARETLTRPLRIIAQVMNLGTPSDCATVQRHFGRRQMKAAIQQADPGWFNPRSWTYWHYQLGLTPWGDEAPPLPERKL